MKKVILTCVLAIFAFVSTNGQTKPTTFIWNEKNLKEIGCSDEQITKIIEIKNAATEKRSAVMAASLPEKELKAQRGKILKDRNDAIMQQLTPAQRAKVKEIEEKLKEEAGK